jgi:CPA1 family monovalent cation:H+ antiporter
LQAPDAHQTVVLLLIAAIVSMAARRLRLPASTGLIAAGFMLSLLPLRHGQIGLTPTILFTVLLPALVFESAINLNARELQCDWLPLLSLVTVGVGVNMAVASLGMHYVAKWPWHTALIFGAVTSATDPIAVLATFKDANIRGRPRLLAEAESLLNDGVAVVAFGLVLLASAHLSPASYAAAAGLSVWRTVVLGTIVGAAIGWALTLLMGTTHDPLTETMLTFVAAYGAYFAASAFGGSGILAAVASGLVVGNINVLGRRYLSDRGKEIVEAMWEFAAFAANALVFLLMGFNLHHAEVHEYAGAVLTGIAFGLLGRAAAVYVSCALVARSRRSVPPALQHILVWGGQRGALSLILAISVARVLTDGREFLTTTAGLVVFSIMVQGVTFKPGIARFLARPEADVQSVNTD